MANSDHPKTARPGRGLWWGGLGVLVLAAVASLMMSARGKMRQRDEITRDIADARQVIIALRLDAADEGGGRIEKLDDLLRKGALLDESVLYKALPDGTKQARWIYLGDAADLQHGSLPLIVSAEPRNGKRIVGTSDTSVEVMREEAWQAWLRDHGRPR